MVPYGTEVNETEIVKIPVTLETREKLKTLGQKGDTYDQIIRRLMKEGTKES